MATLDHNSLCVNSQIKKIKTTLVPKMQSLMTEKESPSTPSPLYANSQMATLDPQTRIDNPSKPGISPLMAKKESPSTPKHAETRNENPSKTSISPLYANHKIETTFDAKTPN